MGTRFIPFSGFKLVGFLIATILIIVLLLALIRPPATIFVVTLQTERVHFSSGSAPISPWGLRDVLIHSLASNLEVDSTWKFSGSFQLASFVDVTVERIAHGPVTIAVEANNAKQSAGEFSNEREIRVGEAGEIVDFVITDLDARADSGITFVIPLTVHPSFEPAPRFDPEGNTPLLRAGKIRLLGIPWMGKKLFMVDEIILEPGDQIRIEEPDSPTSGFIAANEKPGLNVVYHVRARKLEIVRPGPQSYEISITLWDQLRYDPVVSLISAMVVAMSVLIVVLSGIITIWLGVKALRSQRNEKQA